MTDREIMQQALEALEYHVAQTRPIHLTSEVIHALRSRLAQPEKEPAALVINGVLVKSELPEKYTGHLYTAPPQQEPVFDCPRCGHCCPQRQWVGLTDEEIEACRQQGYANGGLNAAFDFDKAAGELLAKAKEKNT